MAINHYQLLGIPQDADLKRIKAAYRSMAKRFHPDANKGSEAAADLFRKINEAYRVLSDEQLRQIYNEKTIPPPVQPTQRKRAQKKTASIDPQQKFNQFLNSLLGAIFEAPDEIVEQPIQPQAPPRPQQVRKAKRKPDFNFYYYLAVEQEKKPYSCDDDGIYRRNKEDRKEPSKSNNYRRTPGSSFVLLLLVSFIELFKQ